MNWNELLCKYSVNPIHLCYKKSKSEFEYSRRLQSWLQWEAGPIIVFKQLHFESIEKMNNEVRIWPRKW